MNKEIREKMAKIGEAINEALAENDAVADIVRDLQARGYKFDMVLEVTVKPEGVSRSITKIAFTEEEHKFFAQYEREMRNDRP